MHARNNKKDCCKLGALQLGITEEKNLTIADASLSDTSLDSISLCTSLICNIVCSPQTGAGAEKGY